MPLLVVNKKAGKNYFLVESENAYGIVLADDHGHVTMVT
jgi:hypothetical protein